MVQLSEHFGAVDGRGDKDWVRRQREFARNREQHGRKEKLEDKQADDLAAVATEIVMATDAQIRIFEKKLDHYEQLTVTALMENQQKLDLIEAELIALLDRAYVVEDGRRVFKTEDGSQVFDEFGAEVSADEIDPALIGDEHPTWEEYQPVFLEQKRLQSERAELLEFQSKLDEAREEIEGREISEADLDELDAELADLMPPSINPNTKGLEDIASTSELTAPKATLSSSPQSPKAGIDTPAL